MIWYIYIAFVLVHKKGKFSVIFGTPFTMVTARG